MITPADSASSPENYNAVATQGMDIQAPQQDLSAMTAAAQAEALSRQAPTLALLHSDAGMGDFDIMQGYTGSWGVVSEPNVDGP